MSARFVVIVEVDDADALDFDDSPKGEWTLLPPEDSEFVGHFDATVISISCVGGAEQ